MSEIFPSPSDSEGQERSFAVDIRSRRADRIVPVFLPFSGCPCRCVYCAQDRQTGAGMPSVGGVLEEAFKRLDGASPGDRELAFYGGTFTALPLHERQACLALLDRLRSEGIVRCARCSTRPDSLSGEKLDGLKCHGLSLIELGIQSFDDEALSLSRRGYGSEAALQGCRTVQASGFSLGIQLLPGMPGSTPEIFLRDVETALSLRPSCLRFYPCLVPEGTVLARWYKEGRYRPWSLDVTVDVLGRALASAWAAGVPVIRLSVAPESGFDTSLLAGPRHPALGALIQAEALLRTVKDLMSQMEGRPEGLELPARCQGFIYGEKGTLRSCWEAMGLSRDRISFADVESGRLWMA